MSDNTPTYESRMMNIPCPNHSADDPMMAYKLGHRDARHEASSIAVGADATIAALRAELQDAEEDRRESAAMCSRLRIQCNGLRADVQRLTRERDEWEGHCIAMRPSLRTPDDVKAQADLAAARQRIEHLEKNS